MKPSIVLENGQPWLPSDSQWKSIQQGLIQSSAFPGGQFPAIGSYKGASATRRAAWSAAVGSADADLFLDLEELRGRSRELARNSPVVAGALLTLCSSVVGPGLRPQPRVNKDRLGISDDAARAMEQLLKDTWAEWSESVEADSTRVQDFGSIQNLAFRSSHESGDAMVLLPMFRRPGSDFMTKVQIVEADRVCNPQNGMDSDTMRMGVEIDATTGAPVRYHVREAHPGEYYNYVPASKAQSWQQVQAFGRQTGRRNAWLLFQQQRPGQHRGVPYFATILEQLKQIERYTDAELAASVIGGTFTVFVTSESGQGIAPLASVPFNTPQDTVNTETDIGLEYGSIVDLRPGEKIELANPSRPNQAFGDFVRSVLEQLGVGIGIPFELLIKHFTASYSASRAALLEAWRFFLWKRRWFAMNFCQPIYEAVITEAIMMGRINMPLALQDRRIFKGLTQAAWIGPAPGQLDPLKEAKAITEKLNAGVTSLAIEVPQATGEDWQTVHEQRVVEVTKRRDDNIEEDLALSLAPTQGASGPAPAQSFAQQNPEAWASIKKLVAQELSRAADDQLALESDDIGD